jgi:hypothetical protein
MVVLTMLSTRFDSFSFSFLVNALPLFNFMSLCSLLATNYQISYCGELWAIFDNIPCQRLHISQYKYTWLFYKSNFGILFFFIFCSNETNENSFLKVFQILTYLLCRPIIIYLRKKVVCLWVLIFYGVPHRTKRT